jgi:hypothetical protein
MSRLLSITFVVLWGIWPSPAGTRAQSAKPSSKPALTTEQRALMTNSRRAIVQTGISEAYFDKHFSLVKVVNQSSDRRILWKFRINEYETMISDVLGFYTKDGKRVDIHSVATTLHTTDEIQKTIPRKTANQFMQRCIGRFRNPTIEYRKSGDGPAELVLSAESVPKVARSESREKREREEREARERAARNQNPKEGDEIESEGDEDHPPIFTGSINLQTGKCVKGQLISTP